MKKVQFKQKKIKLRSKWHSVNTEQVMQHVLIMQQISLLPTYTELISKVVFLRAFAYKNAGL